ncbi:MAG: DUF2628 domain-containing protein [Desulfovibrio sp.]|jgi:hypothetical protein|nr:DUF2628 domain-containing protein [Desulfovibrio sp.]
MICPFCKEEIADGAIKCKHCSSMLPTEAADGRPVLAASDAHARIDALSVSEGLKQKLHLVHDHLQGTKFGFPDYGRDRKIYSKMHCWWAFLFGPLYYLAKGMWRKALVLMGLAFIFDFIICLLLIPNPILAASLPGLVAASIAMPSAYYDIYRKEILKETFWW